MVIEIDLSDDFLEIGIKYAETIGITFDDLVNCILRAYIEREGKKQD